MSYHHYDYDAHGGVLTNYSYYNNYGHISNNINSNNYNNYNNNYTSTDDITTAYTNANNKYCNNNNNNSDTAASTNLYETNHRSNSIFGNSGKMQTQTQNQTTVPDVSDRNTTGCCNICSAPPPVIFLFVTLLMTTSATAMLCAAIMTDHWEHVTWDRNILEKITNQSGQRLEWILNDRVALLPPKNPHRNNKNVFLVPMHGGIWTLCVDLTPREFIYLKHNKNLTNITQPCINYLAGSSVDNSRIDEQQQQQRNDWQHSESQTTLHPHLRMQNLSISCSLVCLIILGSAALVGTFGICHRQISAILITGVMYLLAALFALFTLMIIHFKRQQGRPMLDSDFDGTVDGLLSDKGAAKAAQNLLGARIFITSWSLDLGWGGVVLCSITSVLWILLSKIMRYNPISAFMI